MLRVRIPGGRIAATALEVLAAASTDCADGSVQLTSRANLQLRGVRTTGDGAVDARLIAELAGAGLLPHPTHERVRNIQVDVADPTGHQQVAPQSARR